MQISRLLEIVYILLEKRSVTAKELSERFEVSQRTIYRDIDALSAAGIPVYASKGKGGGIRLLDQFVLNKSILTDKEQIEILSSLQGLKALNVSDVEPVLQKLAVMFDKSNTSWIDVDFSYWGSKSAEREKFDLLKAAILNRHIVSFDYYSSYGEKTERIIEPLRLLFKGQGWYQYGFCRNKGGFRMFRITRMRNLTCSSQSFSREIPEEVWSAFREPDTKMIKLVLRLDEKIAYRVYDEYDQENIVRNDDGSFTVTVYFPEGEWVYGYVLSYGDYAEVLEPLHIREIIKDKIEKSLNKYL